MSRLRCRPRRRDSERGAFTAVVVVLFVALMVLAGLVVDGGNAINARQKIADDVEQAARLGADQIDIATLRATGNVIVLQDQARAEAVAYLAGLGYAPGRVGVGFAGNEVSVSAEDTIRTQLLSLIFINSFEVRGVAVARPAVGIDQEVP